MIRLFIASLCVLVGLIIGVVPASAAELSSAGLKIAPLEYRTNLASGENKKGYIHISNPTKHTIKILVDVKAFRQMDGQGSLEFYDDPAVSSGIRPDLGSFTLKSRQAIRMYFLLDGSKLPSGDVFGALFFTTDPNHQKKGVSEAIRLGTLFSIINRTPGQRDAEITGLSLPWLQTGETIKGTYQIKNTGDPVASTGFYPDVTISRQPFNASVKTTSSLVFAGISRENDFSIDYQWPSIYYVDVAYGASHRSQWVVAATPFHLFVIGTAFVVIAGAIWRYRRFFRLRSSRR